MGKGLDVAHRDGHRGWLEVRHDSDPRADSGASASGGLLGHPFLSFVKGAHDTKIGSSVVSGEMVVGHGTVKVHPLANPQLAREALERFSQRASSYEVEHRVRYAQSGFLKSPEQ
jgi:hypothetical protein